MASEFHQFEVKINSYILHEFFLFISELSINSLSVKTIIFIALSSYLSIKYITQMAEVVT